VEAFVAGESAKLSFGLDILRSSILIATHLVDLEIGNTRRMQPSSPFLLDHTQGETETDKKPTRFCAFASSFPR
jgi:hypothetical protein